MIRNLYIIYVRLAMPACDLELPGIGKKQMLMNGRLLKQLPGASTRILLVMEDVTQRLDRGQISANEWDGFCY